MALPRRCRRDTRAGGAPKKAYRTETEAQTRCGAGENVYWCTHCCNYHIGHELGLRTARAQIEAKKQRQAARRATLDPDAHQ